MVRRKFKILHVEADEVTKVIHWMKGIYNSHMKESCGMKHTYLGMDLDLSLYGDVRVTMADYLKNIVSEFPDTIQLRLVTFSPLSALEKISRKLCHSSLQGRGAPDRINGVNLRRLIQ